MEFYPLHSEALLDWQPLLTCKFLLHSLISHFAQQEGSLISSLFLTMYGSAGPPIDPVDGHVFLKTPPVSVMLGQDMIETTVVKSEGASTKKHHLEQSLFSFVSSASDDGLCIFPMSVNVKLESPSSFVERISYSLINFRPIRPSDTNAFDDLNGPPQKRLKLTPIDDVNQELDDVMHEVQNLSEHILATLDDDII